MLFRSRSGITYLSDRISSAASINIRSELRKSVLEKVLKNEGTDTHELGTAGLSLLLTKGISGLDSYFGRFIPQLFIAIITPTFVAIVIAVTDIKSGLIVLCTLPLIPIFGILIGKFTAAATSKKWETLNLLGGYFLDLITGLTTLRVYGRHKQQNEKLQKTGDDYRHETMKVLRISFLSSLALELVATLSVALLAVTIGLRLVNGSISLSSGLLILIIAPEVYWPIRQVASYFHAASDGLEAFNKIYKILEKSEGLGNIEISEVLGITWSQLTVNYPNRNQVIIPSGQLNTGEIHLLVGASGSGKSTLAQILMGFIKPNTGEILISTNQGSFSINEIKIESLRSKLSWLPQEPKFPIASVSQILRHAKPNASEFDLIAALNTVDLDVANLPNGLRTEVGNIKNPLSIGQLRKIALARALIKDAQLIILDEPSTHLDLFHKVSLFKLLKKLAIESNKCILFSTHDIDLAIQLSDEMIVMTEENVIQDQPCNLISNGIFDTLFKDENIKFDSEKGRFMIR